MKCHCHLCLPPASNKKIGKYLEEELHVTPDGSPPVGPPQPQGSVSSVLVDRFKLAWAAAPVRPPAAARAALGGCGRPPTRSCEGCARYSGVGLQPPFSLRRRLAPVAALPRNSDGTASTGQTGPYDGPPSAGNSIGAEGRHLPAIVQPPSACHITIGLS